MNERKKLSQRTRFEIFKRDGFRCLYCGATPMQAVLRVDHVKPVADGGDDSAANLVTSCFDCNAGKGAVPLDRKKHAVPVGSEEHREHAEQILQWLEVQRGVADAKNQVGDALREEWRRRFGDDEPQGLRTRLNRAAEEFGVAKVVEALDIVEERCDSRRSLDRLRYLYGVLRRWREDGAATPLDGRLADAEREAAAQRHRSQTWRAVVDDVLQRALRPLEWVSSDGLSQRFRVAEFRIWLWWRFSKASHDIGVASDADLEKASKALADMVEMGPAHPAFEPRFEDGGGI